MDWLARAAGTRPDHPAVVADDATHTYAELDARATDLAGAFMAAGLGPGAHVATLLPGSAAYVAAIHALLRLGAALVPLDPRLAPAELRARAELAEADAVLTTRSLLPAAEATGRPALTLQDLSHVAPRPVPRRTPGGLQGVVFTSGTGGRPRAVRLTAANHLASAAASALNLGARPDDRWLAGVPLFHVGGLAAVFRSCLQATTLVVHPRFDATRVVRVLDEGITLASMVPVMLARVLEARGGEPPAALRAVLLGGDAAPPGLVAAARASGWPVLPTYGLTEAASQVSCASPLDAALPAGSAGRPLALHEVAILDAQGNALPEHAEGEIALRGPAVMQGYHRDPEATAAALQGGWLRTGDLGRLDAQGYLWVTGRARDRIATGGEKVDPAEVEQVLRDHPAVADACVVGVPDPQWGERVAAAVVPRGDLDLGALEAHCRAALAGFKVPRQVAVVDALPRSPAGKLLRHLVRQGFLPTEGGDPPTGSGQG